MASHCTKLKPLARINELDEGGRGSQPSASRRRLGFRSLEGNGMIGVALQRTVTLLSRSRCWPAECLQLRRRTSTSLAALLQVPRRRWGRGDSDSFRGILSVPQLVPVEDANAEMHLRIMAQCCRPMIGLRLCDVKRRGAIS
jgi:hypothetical protein